MPPEYFERVRETVPGAELGALRVFLALRTAARRVENVVAGWLDAIEMTPTKLDTLHILASMEPAVVTIGKLRHHLRMTQPNVTFVVQGMERDGLVTRSRAPGDGRSSVLTLTARGRSVVEISLHAYVETMRAALVRLSPDDAERLIDALAVVTEGFEAADFPKPVRRR